MGQSTDAKLIYGIDIGEEWIIPKEWNGLTEEDDDYWAEEISDYIEETADPYRPEVEVEYYCSCDYPMYVIAVPNTTICVPRGYTEQIIPDELNKRISDLSLKRYQSWVKEHLPEPFRSQNPGWILCSMWC